jgi:hypothetical protein
MRSVGLTPQKSYLRKTLIAHNRLVVGSSPKGRTINSTIWQLAYDLGGER